MPCMCSHTRPALGGSQAFTARAQLAGAEGVAVITDQRAEQAFEYLRDTTAKIGAAKAELKRAEILSKCTRKRAFIDSQGSSVAEREAKAEVHEDVILIDDRYCKAVEAFETLSATRDVETIALDVWRTEAANRRRA